MIDSDPIREITRAPPPSMGCPSFAPGGRTTLEAVPARAGTRCRRRPSSG
jgi:hypothetical protein